MSDGKSYYPEFFIIFDNDLIKVTRCPWCQQSFMDLYQEERNVSILALEIERKLGIYK